MSENEKKPDCCGTSGAGHSSNRGEKMHEKYESKEETENKGGTKWLLLGLGVLFVLSAWQTFQLSNTLGVLNARAAGITLSAAATPQSGALDTSGWTATEKMNYDMHGIIPARVQGTAGASSTTSTSDLTQGLPSQVGGC